jgi:transposase
MEVNFEKINKDIQVYPEAFKRKVVEEYLYGPCTKMDLLRKYGIKTKSGIQRWMKTFGYTDTHQLPKINFTRLTLPTVTKKIDLNDNDELQKRIKELERQLEDEKLRSEAYARMIEKAEKELKISIRKKTGTK